MNSRSPCFKIITKRIVRTFLAPATGSNGRSTPSFSAVASTASFHGTSLPVGVSTWKCFTPAVASSPHAPPEATATGEDQRRVGVVLARWG